MVFHDLNSTTVFSKITIVHANTLVHDSTTTIMCTDDKMKCISNILTAYSVLIAFDQSQIDGYTCDLSIGSVI